MTMDHSHKRLKSEHQDEPTRKRSRQKPSTFKQAPIRGSSSNTPTTTPVRFLIMSDTHDNMPPSTPPCDVLLHCGDFTEDGSPQSISDAVTAISKVEAELKLVIAGNHEISLDKAYYLSEGGTAEDHVKSFGLVYDPSITFLQEGTHSFTLKSGAHFTIYVSPWTPRYGASAFQYPTNEDRFNPAYVTPSWAENVGIGSSIIPEGVDIVMTHGPPQYILDRTSDGRAAGCEHLRRAIARVQPRMHCFGHIHAGYGAQRVLYQNSGTKANVEGDECMTVLPKEFVGKNQAKRKGFAALPPGSVEALEKDDDQTLMVNAAIMDENNEPGNAPWVVDLDLPDTQSERLERDSESIQASVRQAGLEA